MLKIRTCWARGKSLEKLSYTSIKSQKKSQKSQKKVKRSKIKSKSKKKSKILRKKSKSQIKVKKKSWKSPKVSWIGGWAEQNLWAVGVFGKIWAGNFGRPRAVGVFVGKKSKWKFEKSQKKFKKSNKSQKKVKKSNENSKSQKVSYTFFQVIYPSNIIMLHRLVESSQD